MSRILAGSAGCVNFGFVTRATIAVPVRERLGAVIDRARAPCEDAGIPVREDAVVLESELRPRLQLPARATEDGISQDRRFLDRIATPILAC